MAVSSELKDAFEAFNILYYPVAKTDGELATACALADDADMAFSVTCAGNMEGTGYAIVPADILMLAGVHHHLVQQAGHERGGTATPNPAADIRELVPNIQAAPMYPGFPREVLEIDEALYRFHQALHYASTYGVEYVSELVGTPVTVSRGWLPHDNDPQGGGPKANGGYKVLVQPKYVRLALSEERMRAIVLDRLAKPTRMHDAEIRCTVHTLTAPGQEGPIDIAFHENMLGLVGYAAEESTGKLARMLGRTAQHPGDVLKAITFVRKNRPDGKKHLANRQKRAFCQALEGFSYDQLAMNIAQAKPEDRLSLNYLSLARFGGEKLKRAVADVEDGTAKSWNAEVEQQWMRLAEDGPEPLLARYAERPGVLLRSLTRLVKAGIPIGQIEQAVAGSDAFSLATLVRTFSIMSSVEPKIHIHKHPGEDDPEIVARKQRQYEAFAETGKIIGKTLAKRLAALQTPLRGKRVFVDAGDFSLEGSVVMPNDTGDTGTAYPPVGMAYRIPDDATVRFFTFWDDRKKRVDVDLHFQAKMADGTVKHIGWNSDFRGNGMVMSGDITHSENAVEYLDIDLAAARATGVQYVRQECHIYAGAPNWGDIATCFSGALVVDTAVKQTAAHPGQAAVVSTLRQFGAPGAAMARQVQVKAATVVSTIYQGENVIFRDDMTGPGRRMDYATIDCEGGYVRIVRGADIPFKRTAFTLERYIEMLLGAQDATRVDAPEDADVVLSVGRTEDDAAICLIDEGFFLE